MGRNLSLAEPLALAAPTTVKQVEEFDHLEVDPRDVLLNGKLDLYPALHKKGYVEVRVGVDATRVQAKGFVGLIPINDRLTLEVVPRVPLESLSRLLEISGRAPVALAHALRTYETEGQMYPSLAVVYAMGLRQAVEQVVDLGLLKEYERVEDVSSSPRGRIDLNRTIQAALGRGVTHRAANVHFRRTADNPANRCLLYAVWRLSKYVDQIEGSLPRPERRNIRRDLNYTWHALDGVSLDGREKFLQDGLVTGRRALPSVRDYYRPALDLALTVIGREAVIVERSGGVVRLPSLVVDLTTVFEAYVRRVLGAAAAARRWPTVVLDGNLDPPVGGAHLLLRSGVDVKATPDVVFRRGSSYPLIVEVKYKPAADKRDRHDLNQIICYGLAYGAPVVALVQPRAKGVRARRGRRRLGEIAGIEVFEYVVDLSADLPAEEAALADSMMTIAALR